MENKALSQFCELPIITVVVPMRNEAKYITQCLESILSQDYPQDKIETVVVDGMSEDMSREIVAQFCHNSTKIKILDNPRRITPTALNIGILSAKGEIIILLSGHASLETNYISMCVAHLRKTGADAVGGRAITIPVKTVISQAISLVTSHPFGIGNSRFRYSEKEAYVDTVPYGAYHRELFIQIGLFNEELVRNQDNEFNYRVRHNGGKIFFTPAIKSYYYGRMSLTGLCKQNFKNGLWNVKLLAKSPRAPSPRHLVPLFFVTGLIGSSLASLFSQIAVFLLLGIVLSYSALATIVSASLAQKNGGRYFFPLLLTFPCLHLSYGFGYLAGFLKFGLIDKIPLMRREH